MPTECSRDLFGFAPVEGREVVAAFDGGAITSDAGALLLGATDRAIGMVKRFAACFLDERRAHLIEHEVVTLVEHRVGKANHWLGRGNDDLLTAEDF
jgi:Transposase DDE domain group 1